MKLIEKELILYTGEVSFIPLMANFWIILALIIFLNEQNMLSLIISVVIMILISIYFFLLQKSYRFLIKESSISAKEGLFSTTTVEIELSKIESVLVYQSFMGRFFNYGNITFFGEGLAPVCFEMVKNPYVFREELIKAKDRLIV